MMSQYRINRALLWLRINKCVACWFEIHLKSPSMWLMCELKGKINGWLMQKNLYERYTLLKKNDVICLVQIVMSPNLCEF